MGSATQLGSRHYVLNEPCHHGLLLFMEISGNASRTLSISG
jgi:hypothetical protein